ncbi:MULTISPECIES: hypothetical protein [Halocynthiibacter]|uniref:Uncharacterized protein n=1 Tax=Halocynthiibacter halioticoli TaxID=2986804 RepID=A0AAE3IZ57_9RHOB|nr:MULTISPECIES: hypothetical protein [Halocynthiibacter]MCV6823156.1 hypothetical protein [Halocynthiibacter halioticoli]MCW4056157.1 hypothetical protein [Halocynthiibacter sp. SDUM655004]
MALTMDMDSKKAELLLRAALLDDASNVGERLAALGADISVDDDGDAWIALDMDLWPEDKTSPEAETIAKMLWLDVEWVSTVGTFPFAWPGLSEYSDKTTAYFKMVLDAYGGQGPNKDER